MYFIVHIVLILGVVGLLVADYALAKKEVDTDVSHYSRYFQIYGRECRGKIPLEMEHGRGIAAKRHNGCLAPLTRIADFGGGTDDIVALVGGKVQTHGDGIDLVGKGDDGLLDALGKGVDAMLDIF